jgi:predicted DNA-binding protein (MmcQ/YjbR family)
LDLETLRTICLAKPGATEELQWENHLLYKVGGKIFCVGSLNHEDGAALKVDEEEFDTLTTIDGIGQASHFAKRQWIKIDNSARISIAEWKQLVDKSYCIIRKKLTKKAQAALPPID